MMSERTNSPASAKHDRGGEAPVLPMRPPFTKTRLPSFAPGSTRWKRLIAPVALWRREVLRERAHAALDGSERWHGRYLRWGGRPETEARDRRRIVLALCAIGILLCLAGLVIAAAKLFGGAAQ